MALQYVNNEKDKQQTAVAELTGFAAKAEERLKIVPIVINTVVNIVVQIALFLVSNPWISLPLRILIPICSAILGFALHFNWFGINDAIKFRLIFYYKKKSETRKLKNNIKDFLVTPTDTKS